MTTKKMTGESISERMAMASDRQSEICERTRYSVHGSVGLIVFDMLSEMYNAGYAKAMQKEDNSDNERLKELAERLVSPGSFPNMSASEGHELYEAILELLEG